MRVVSGEAAEPKKEGLLNASGATTQDVRPSLQRITNKQTLPRHGKSILFLRPIKTPKWPSELDKITIFAILGTYWVRKVCKLAPTGRGYQGLQLSVTS